MIFFYNVFVSVVLWLCRKKKYFLFYSIIISLIFSSNGPTTHGTLKTVKFVNDRICDYNLCPSSYVNLQFTMPSPLLNTGDSCFCRTPRTLPVVFFSPMNPAHSLIFVKKSWFRIKLCKGGSIIYSFVFVF